VREGGTAEQRMGVRGTGHEEGASRTGVQKGEESGDKTVGVGEVEGAGWWGCGAG
jgi:hypothetical protein